jgi:hypothetical protein
MERHGTTEEQTEWPLNQPEHEFRIGEAYRYHRSRRFGDRIVVLIWRWKELENGWIGPGGWKYKAGK